MASAIATESSMVVSARRRSTEVVVVTRCDEARPGRFVESPMSVAAAASQLGHWGCWSRGLVTGGL
eukprot:1489615-Prymnesium_polylepis.1